MSQCYRIKNWKGCFEVAQNGACKTWSWIAVPIKHDGKSYRRLMSLPNGAALYGAWILIAAVAAKCTQRGMLIDDNEPLTAEDLFFKTGAPEELFSEALEVLTSERIGWLEVVSLEQTQATLERAQASLEQTQATLETPDITRQYQTKQNQYQTGTGRGETGVSMKRQGKDWGRSAFTNLVVDHFVQCEVLDDWFAWATTKAPSPICRRSGGFSEVNLLRVFGAAERAIEESETPLKLFKHIVGGEKWNLITQAQEDRARARIKKLREVS